MSMPTNDELIDRLTEDLEPTPPVSPGAGRWLIAAASLIAAFLLIERFGMRPDFAAGEPHPVPLLAILVVLAAGSAAAATVTAMARPAVGSPRNGWQWTVAAFAVLPLAALLTMAGDPGQRAALRPADGLFCLAAGTGAAVLTIVSLAWWMRRGAPTSPTRTSWLIGITGGAAGMLAIGIICPADAIAHIGTWHSGVLLLSAVGARLTLPRLLSW